MSGTALIKEIPGWYITFQTAILQQLPRPGQIDQTTAEGWWENQRALKKVLTESLCPQLGRLTAVRVHEDDESALNGREFLRRAKKESRGRSDDEAFNFYARKENWYLLPANVDNLIFPDTEFEIDGKGYIRLLYREGKNWIRHTPYTYINFDRECHAAVLMV